MGEKKKPTYSRIPAQSPKKVPATKTPTVNRPPPHQHSPHLPQEIKKGGHNKGRDSEGRGSRGEGKSKSFNTKKGLGKYLGFFNSTSKSRQPEPRFTKPQWSFKKEGIFIEGRTSTSIPLRSQGKHAIVGHCRFAGSQRLPKVRVHRTYTKQGKWGAVLKTCRCFEYYLQCIFDGFKNLKLQRCQLEQGIQRQSE